MAQSLVKNYLHIVFSTKHRQALIRPEVEPQLYAYLGGVCNKLGCQVLRVGGYVDHVHILCMLSKEMTLSGLVKELKMRSSKWIKTIGPEFSHFYWQSGYGAFSVSYTQTDAVVKYIARQHDHHKTKGFKGEFLNLLKEHQLEFDERYLWD